MTDWVLDASAVLALMRAEPGAEVVVEALPRAAIAAVNAAEVVARLVREGVAPDVARLAVINLGCPILAIDAELGLRAGELAAAADARRLSLGDRCCLALAEREGAPALTADPSWADLGLPVAVTLIR